jgi:hypothetical protein
MRPHRAYPLLLAVLVLTSCDETAVRDITGPDAGARVKFFNFGVNAPAVNFYANDTKMTAISSTSGTESTNGVAFGAAGSGGLYNAIEPAQATLTGRIAAATDKDLPIATVTTNIEDGKHYSFYMSGIYSTATKTVEAFVVEDPFGEAIDYSVAYVRFVNAISNANPMTLYATNTGTTPPGAAVPVGGEVAYKGAGTFTPLPEGVYTLTTRYAGSATNVITRTGVSFLAGRVYTVTSRGDITVTSTTSAIRPQLDNTANR